MKALGLILAGGSSKHMKGLTAKRAAAALPIAASYRAIDFSLSNMTNSHIQKVAVLTQYNSRSLHEHLNSAKWWNFGRKQGGLFVFTPTLTEENHDWYRGTADAIYQNLDFLSRSHEPYVIIASGDGVYRMDYNQVLAYHMEKNADITVVVKELASAEEGTRFGTVSLNEEGRIVEFEEKPAVAKYRTISCGIYVIRRRLLIELVKLCVQEGRYDFVSDILIRQKDTKKIYGYKKEGYWNNVSAVETYYKTNMDFLQPKVQDVFFRGLPAIYSKVGDLPPAKYNPGAVVHNSLVGSGSILNGTVEDSVIFKKVYIGSHCVIRNSLILNDVYIGDNTCIENCIVESGSTLSADRQYAGGSEIQVIAERGERYTI